GCAASFLISSLLMEHSIMTEKIARRGARVLLEYRPDYLGGVLVRDRASREVVTLPGEQMLETARAWLLENGPGTRHNGFPVLGRSAELIGVVTRSEILHAPEGAVRIVDLVRREPIVVFEDSSLREAADKMVLEGVGRVVVVDRADPSRVRGI